MFVAQTGLTWRLAVDLLDKMNNPDNHQPYSEGDDDDLEVRARFQITLGATEVSTRGKDADVCVLVAVSDELTPATKRFNDVVIGNQTFLAPHRRVSQQRYDSCQIQLHLRVEAKRWYQGLFYRSLCSCASQQQPHCWLR